MADIAGLSSLGNKRETSGSVKDEETELSPCSNGSLGWSRTNDQRINSPTSNLTPQLEELVRQKVASGHYSSASEVVREALRLMQREDQIQAAKLAQLRHDIQDGLESGSAGRLDVDAIKRRGRARLDAAKANRDKR
jgi:antitoxin ParD1/3/4